MGKEKETWLPIVTYEGHYEVSNLGRVKSLERVARFGKVGRCKIKEKIMVLMDHQNGYKVVWLRNGHHQKFFVHRLVAAAFLPNPLKLPVVNHKDRNKKNNHLSNLEWVSFSENTQHYYATEKMIKPIAVVVASEEPDVEFDDILSHALGSL